MGILQPLVTNDFTDQNVCLVKFDNNLDTLWVKTYGFGSGIR